jgi:hypothetical protein
VAEAHYLRNGLHRQIIGVGRADGLIALAPQGLPGFF